VGGAQHNLQAFVQRHLSALSELTGEMGEELLTSVLAAGETSIDSHLIALLTTDALTKNNKIEPTSKLTGERLECLLGSRSLLRKLEAELNVDELDKRLNALDSVLVVLKLYALDLNNRKTFYQ